MQSPSDITYHSRSKTLEVTFPDGTYQLSAELLRVYSPSAEVRGHGPSERQLQTGKKHVAVTAIEPVGNYGISIAWSDGHTTGIYRFDFLREICNCEACAGQA